MDLFEAMETCRSIRRLKPDPVPPEMLEQLIHYATCAPSAGNAQLWGFVVVTEEADRRFFGDLLRKAWGDRLPPEPPAADTSARARGARTFRRFVTEFDRIPAFILCCCENAYPPGGDPNPIFVWSTAYPATQNLLLAARGLGLGAAMTTLHIVDEAAIKERFGIPDNVWIGSTIPVGYPEGQYGPLNRKPVTEVLHWGRWGVARPA